MKAFVTSFAVAAVVGTLTLMAPLAASASSQLERQVASQLKRYKIDADVETLTNDQLTQIFGVMNSPKSSTHKKGAIKKIIEEGAPRVRK